MSEPGEFSYKKYSDKAMSTALKMLASIINKTTDSEKDVPYIIVTIKPNTSKK